jgi:hypothetical protein
MGGPGSGRSPRKLSIEDARALAIGELCDGGAARALPRGEIVWRQKGSGKPLALLAYRIASEQQAGRAVHSLLLYLYWPRVDAWPQGDAVELIGGAGKRHLALCPAPGCDQKVRTLFAPLREKLFFCRGCHNLVYRSSAKARGLRLLREVLKPALAEIEVACSGAGPLPDETELADLGVQESRLACLRLKAAGLSCRQIAAQVGISKSSVQRYVTAGRSGVDLSELCNERLLHSFLPAHEEIANDDRALARELASIDRDAKRFGLYRHSATENEVKVLFRAAGEEDDAGPLVAPADYARCFDSLREQGQRRLSLEAKARPRVRRRW